jgi:hypothetical protein
VLADSCSRETVDLQQLKAAFSEIDSANVALCAEDVLRILPLTSIQGSFTGESISKNW